MATSARAFRIGLYIEHLEEASFLYDQRRALLANPEIPWTRIGDFEERLEAHIDALVVGRDLALEVCRERIAQGDPGELFAALCVACRHAFGPMLTELLKGLDYQDPDRGRAVVDALKYELPKSWHDHCRRAISQGNDGRNVLLAQVIGYCRMTDAPLIGLLNVLPPDGQAMVLWATGRTRETGAASAIQPFYQAKDPRLQSSALHAGIRLHHPEALRQLRVHALAGQPPSIESGLAGGRQDVPQIVNHLLQPEPSRDGVVALGLLGDLSSVRPLIRMLSVEPLAAAAAEALHVITGAALFEEVFVPDPVSEEELFDKEVRALRERGEIPHRLNGEPFGSQVRRLSHDADAWEDWLQRHVSQFNADRRYRIGRPYHPEVLLDCLNSEAFPKSYRRLVAEELLVRYGIDLPFEADMPVAARDRCWLPPAPVFRRVQPRSTLDAGISTDALEPSSNRFLVRCPLSAVSGCGSLTARPRSAKEQSTQRNVLTAWRDFRRRQRRSRPTGQPTSSALRVRLVTHGRLALKASRAPRAESVTGFPSSSTPNRPASNDSTSTSTISWRRRCPSASLRTSSGTG